MVALNQGARVGRTFELIDSAGKSIRPLKSGDTVARGSYIRSTLSAHLTSGSFQYALAVNPKISGAEYTPLNDVQVSSVHVLKEDKASGVFWHHEVVRGRLNNSSVCRVELAGKYLVAPAYVELMYDTAVRGHSGSFRLIVTDQQQQ